MKIAMVAQHATPLRTRDARADACHVRDDDELSQLTQTLADLGHQVTVYAEKLHPDQPASGSLGHGVRVEHIPAAMSRRPEPTRPASSATPSCWPACPRSPAAAAPLVA